MSVAFTVIIPARYESTRLPGKPLADLGGKPMIQHTWERACASGAQNVYIATDDRRVLDAARGFGADARLTAAAHPSGTDRAAEVADAEALGDDAIVVNLQGDEPFTDPRLLAQAAVELDAWPDAQMATLREPILDARDVFDPNVVKVVTDAAGFALYFSRAPIPWYREAFARRTGEEVLPDGVCHFRHLGLYAYRAGFLRRFVAAPPAAIERAEALEQLRALDFGARIRVPEAVVAPGPGIDTLADLERARATLAGRA